MRMRKGCVTDFKAEGKQVAGVNRNQAMTENETCETRQPRGSCLRCVPGSGNARLQLNIQHANDAFLAGRR